MATIQKRETARGIRWRAMVRLKGAPVVSQTFARRAAAKRWADRLEVEIRSGRFLPRLEAEKHTLGEAIDRFLSEHDGKDLWSRTQLSWWRDRLGSYSLAQITPAAISRVRDALIRGEVTCPHRLYHFLC